MQTIHDEAMASQKELAIWWVLMRSHENPLEMPLRKPKEIRLLVCHNSFQK